MELEKNTINAFINYLKDQGYPKENIVPVFGEKKCAIDLAIVADDLTTPIALFEIKGKKSIESVTQGVKQLERATNLWEITIPCYLVFPYDKWSGDGWSGFDVIDVSEYINNNLPIDSSEIMKRSKQESLLSFKNLHAGSSSKIIQKNIKKKQKRIDRIKWFCWLIFPLIAIALLVLDALDIYEITYQRLAVVGAGALIVLIPFFSEISLKDITLKRKSGEK